MEVQVVANGSLELMRALLPNTGLSGRGYNVKDGAQFISWIGPPLPPEAMLVYAVYVRVGGHAGLLPQAVLMPLVHVYVHGLCYRQMPC